MNNKELCISFLQWIKENEKTRIAGCVCLDSDRVKLPEYKDLFYLDSGSDMDFLFDLFLDSIEEKN